MIATNQLASIEQLNSLAAINRQSVLIEGPEGSGKSFLAKKYANIVKASDFISISPKVAEIKEAIEATYSNDNTIVICIENLDLGVSSASYALLKTLEEPSSNVFIVITCRNIRKVPDTIISRSAVVSLAPPTINDLAQYAQSVNMTKFSTVSHSRAWRCSRSFSDVDKILNMGANELAYYESIESICKFNDSVSNIVWNISHYDNNKESDVTFAIRSIIDVCNNPFITKCGVACLDALSSGRVAKHAVLSRFAFDVKYCE